ncbi:MAG: oligosaccharide flippase family protein [Candidatus Nanoarchaeia archaeon]|nr:oligosaccharide flippase family protein [Candidatus Nanoarchaeia archaeon]MDD5587630.1 oligosaccharide flippase family protein [Candidatus Nanoarchaeia archaeon]
MHKKIINYIKNEAILQGSITLIIYTMILYICSYLYQSYTGRVLGAENYRIIAVVFSLLAIVLVSSTTIQMSITKFVSEFKAKKEYGKIKYLLLRSYKKLVLISIFIFIFFILISPIITKFFKIGFLPIIFLALMTIVYLALSISRGVLQGLQNFKSFGFNLSIEGLGKIIFAVLLVSLGFGVNGALFALVLAVIVAFIFILFKLKEIFKCESEKFDTKHIYNYSWPVLFTFLFLTLSLYLDLWLVNYFFPGVEAGFYGALSTIGKIVFFASNPVAQAMFPIASEEKVLTNNKKSLSNILYKAFGITFLIGFGITAVYFLFSKLIVAILFGNTYLTITPLLWLYGLVMTIYSFNYLLAFYNLSLHKTNITPLIMFFLFNLFEIIFIWKYHNTFIQIIYSLIILNSILFIYLLIYTKYSK